APALSATGTPLVGGMWQPLQDSAAVSSAAWGGAKIEPCHSLNVRSRCSSAGAGGDGTSTSWQLPQSVALSTRGLAKSPEYSAAWAGLACGSRRPPRMVTPPERRSGLLWLPSTASTSWQK